MSLLGTIRRAKTYLEEQRRVSLGALRREFDLDDATLAELVEELVEIQQVAIRDGKALAWTGPARSAERLAEAAKEPKSAGGRRSSGSARADAERRQLTVLFCDLVDSTRLAAGLDPEDWREVVRVYQEAAAAVVERFDGYVAQYLGDGLLIYFGYPKAHEDDAERAVRAALGIAEAIAECNLELERRHGLRLAVRAGIHTGPVVVGEMGGGQRRETLALGETTNLAARLQRKAEPGAVVISADTLRLVRGIFVTEDCGPRRLDGIADPVRLHRVIRPSGTRSRLDIAAAGGLTPLVGREQELALLFDRWEQAKEGNGQVVLLSGEAGIGKSRLVHALRERLGKQPHTWLECRGSAYHTNTALYPLIELLRQGLLLGPEDAEEQKISCLERGVDAAGFSPTEAIPLFTSLLEIPLPERYAPLALSAEAHRRRALEALTRWLLAQAELQPAAFVIEDLHWIDPSSLELIGMLIQQAPTAPVLLIPTFRPPFDVPWPSRGHLAHLTLNPLSHRQIATMVGSITRGKALPASVLEQLVKKTDGVPLFVEELTKSVLESGLLAEAEDRYERADPLPELAIPSTLKDSLMARLDRLGPAKEMAQLAAVLGRDFPRRLLESVFTGDVESLENALARLVRAELLHQRGAPPSASYTFKHALIRDTAYTSLLKSRRQEYHARVADALRLRFSGLVESAPEILARHYEAAGNVEEAVSCYARAGEQAAQRSANVEAIGHLEKALELLAQLSDTRERRQQELMLQVAIGAPSQLIRGYRTPETERAYTRALKLCREVGETPQLSQALWGLWSFYLVGSDLEIACELGRQLLKVGERAEDRSLVLLAHLALGVPRVFSGEFTAALQHLEQTISLHDVAQDRLMAYRYGQDPGVMARPFAAFSHWFLGRPDRALAAGEEAIEVAQELGHPYSIALAHAYATLLHQLRREYERALERADEVIAISELQEFPLWHGLGIISRARALAGLGACEGRVQEIQRGLADVAATGTVAGGPLFICFLSDVQELAGFVDDAIGALDMALALSHGTGSRYWDAEIHRRKGELLSRSGAPDPEIEGMLLKALDVAYEQQGKSLVLRTATSLAQLWRRQDRKDEAHALLAPIYQSFTEGFDTPDLKEAKRLLEELA